MLDVKILITGDNYCEGIVQMTKSEYKRFCDIISQLKYDGPYAPTVYTKILSVDGDPVMKESGPFGEPIKMKAM